MPRLLLLRHAKAVPAGGMDDVDRPLAPRGRNEAAALAAYMKAEGLAPDLALVSPARRTRETWDLVQPALGAVRAEIGESLFEATSETLLDTVRAAEPAVGSLLLVGHNPAVEELARALAGDGERDAYRALMRSFPPATLAVLAFPVESWADVAARGGRLERFVTPESLGVKNAD